VSDRKRILIDPPSEMVILAARHLDQTEGRVQTGTTVDASTRSAINAVLDYIATAHNAPAAATEKGVTRRPCRYCPDPLCPEDCPECGSPIHDLDAVPAQQQPARLPRQGEIWHPADDPDDCVSVTGVSGNIVFYQAPPDARRGRSVPWNNSTNTDNFTRCYIPPQETP
jgi:hypothetical protein